MIDIASKLLLYYPKYNAIQTTDELFDTRTEVFDIYIDLYRLVCSVYKPDVTIDRISQERQRPLVLVSSIVNMCAHFRDYYRRAFRANTRIFLVYSSGKFTTSKKYYSGYDKTNEALRTNDRYKCSIIEKSISLLGSLAAYLPDIYLVKTDYEVYLKVYDIIQKEYCGYPSILYTKEHLSCLLASEMDEIVVFNHISGRNDRIVVSNRYNAIETFYEVDNKNISSFIKDIRSINPFMLSILIAFTGYKRRDLRACKNIGYMVKRICNLIDQGYISNDYCDPRMVYDNLSKSDKKTIDIDLIENRWKAIDIRFQYEWYKNSFEYTDTSYKIDIDNPKELQYVNDHYFIGMPLDLQRL